MLGAVMFGHKGFQPVIDAIIKLAELAAKEPRDFTPPDHSAISSRRCCAIAEADLRAAYKITDKQERYAAVDAAKAKVKASCSSPATSRGADCRQAGRRRVQGPRRPRSCAGTSSTPASRIDGRDLQDRPPDRRRSRHPAAHPRLGAVHPRRDPGARASPRSAPATTSSIIDALNGTYKETFLLHYNFPPYSVGETGRMGSPGRREIGHGKLAWRAIRPMLPRPTRVPLHDPRRLRDHRVERLVLDGDRLRHLAGADGCGRAAEAAGGRHRHGPDHGRRALRGALRHPRRRGSPRRHGLQGRRHRRTASPRCRWTSRSPASPRRS